MAEEHLAPGNPCEPGFVPWTESPGAEGSLQEERCRRLAIGACHRTHRERVRRVAVDCRGDPCHRVPRLVDHDDWKGQPIGQPTAGCVGQNGNCACIDRLLGKLSPVMVRTGQCHVKIAWMYEPGVHGDATDNGVAQCGTIPEQFGQADPVSGAWPNHAPP